MKEILYGAVYSNFLLLQVVTLPYVYDRDVRIFDSAYGKNESIRDTSHGVEPSSGYHDVLIVVYWQSSEELMTSELQYLLPQCDRTLTLITVTIGTNCCLYKPGTTQRSLFYEEAPRSLMKNKAGKGANVP